MQTKLNVPEHVTSFSYNGMSVDLSAGTVEATSPAMLDTMLSHGFTPIVEVVEVQQGKKARRAAE